MELESATRRADLIAAPPLRTHSRGALIAQLFDTNKGHPKCESILEAVRDIAQMKPFRTDYEFLKGIDYIFVSLDRNLSGEECRELSEKYFETHKRTTLPGQMLRVDLRPAFRKPLADVTPKFRAVSNGHTFTPLR